MINISLRQIHHLNSHVPTPGLSLGISNLTKPFKICSLYIHELTHHIYIPAQIDAYIVKGIFFNLISLRLSFQIKSVPITSEWVKISSSFGKKTKQWVSKKLFNKMMCCSKAEHTRKQNFPYLLIEDYSGASSDNLEEQEEIICDYRRKKYINICTDYRAAVIVH